MSAIRTLTKAERERYSQAIHLLTKHQSSSGFRGLPALRCVFAALIVFVDEDCPTAYTDCRFRVGFSPDMLDPEKTSLEQLAFTIAHETLHNVQRHEPRLRSIPNQLANIAGDLEINSMLALGLCQVKLDNPKDEHWAWIPATEQLPTGEWSSGLCIPEVGSFAEMPAGDTAERYVERVLEKFPSITISFEQGSGGEGAPLPWDDFSVDPESQKWKDAEAIGAHPISGAEEARVRGEAAHDIAQELERGRQKGRGIGDSSLDAMLHMLLKSMAPPRIDWKRVLSMVVSRTASIVCNGRSDYSFARRNRRHAYSDFVFPGFCSYRPKICVALDTSGSMRPEEFERAATEIQSVINNIASEITFFSVEAEAKAPIKARCIKEVMSNLRGGGGTDMSVAVKAVCEMRHNEQPDVLLVITDGHTNWYKVEEALTDRRARRMGFIFCIVREERDMDDEGLERIADQLAAAHRLTRVVPCAI